MAKYAAESKKLFAVFERFTPLVEGLSLDEAFLDLTGSERLLGPPRAVAERLRAEVRRETELAVSVGIAPLKMVAKIASDLAKPDGLLAVEPEGVRGFLDRADVQARMQSMGVDPAVARARVDALTDEEAQQLAGHIDQLPAGADSFWGVLLAIFVILLITDILGLTKIFPFTRSVR